MRNTRMTKLVAGSLLATMITAAGAGVASARVVDLTEAGNASTSSSATAAASSSSSSEKTSAENLPKEASAQAKKMLEDIADNPDLNLPPEIKDVLTAIANSDGSLGDMGSASGIVDESQASDLYRELQPQLKEALEDPSAWNDLLKQLKTGVESIDTEALNDAINGLIRTVNGASGAAATAGN